MESNSDCNHTNVQNVTTAKQEADLFNHDYDYSVTTDRRQFTLFYLFYFSLFLYFICISAFWFGLPVT